MVNLAWRPFLSSDSGFLQELAESSRKWMENELKDLDLPGYLKQYERLSGEWRVWEKGGIPVSVTYHLEYAPSNQKPWLGTILVKADERRRGIASSIMDRLSAKFKASGHKALFAAVPIDEYEWSNFLTDCGFEQFKTEENEGETFLIMVRPLG
ncbi:GNAT family N-acetyltransferase [Cytobacillus oceanisediminis]|uniref:GNAT family N-acetyltransferase n=1 Tax=Cytobacillus oceanisediminis TaxID=665099 RepID=UPI00119D0E1C|nr:GNAT family N-acetyltransferase [Cytobacillus oceanisediminis]